MESLGTPGADQLRHFETPSSIFFDLMLSTRKLRDIGMAVDGPWEFERRANAATIEALSRFPCVKTARPLGWESLCHRHDADDGSMFNVKADLDAFQGVNSAGTRSPAFPERVSPAHVLFDDREQGRKPERVLIAAIYGHFLYVREHNNTVEVLQALDRLPLRANDPEPQWTQPDLTTDQPILQAWLLAVRTDAFGVQSKQASVRGTCERRVERQAFERRG